MVFIFSCIQYSLEINLFACRAEPLFPFRRRLLEVVLLYHNILISLSLVLIRLNGSIHLDGFRLHSLDAKCLSVLLGLGGHIELLIGQVSSAKRLPVLLLVWHFGLASYLIPRKQHAQISLVIVVR